MALKTVSTTSVTTSAIVFIREMQLKFSINGLKPSTRFYAFFDGISIDQYIVQTAGISTASVTGYNNSGVATINTGMVVTDGNGNAQGIFNIPPYKFFTGDRVLKFSDNSDPTIDSLSGSATSFAAVTFSSNGVKKTIQETITTTGVQIIDLIGALGDPLAQSFFTYNVAGGLYVTSIDIYFQSKDNSLPVTLELREMVNGYPGPKVVSNNARVVKPAPAVVVSPNASSATTFTFDYPVYLEQDKDFCFVLLAETNNYYVWTSTLGAKSIETGLTVSSQPYIGSMFKSENNITWTADQYSDIKFTIRQAQFGVNTPAQIKYKAEAPPVLIYGSQITAVSGSNQLIIKFDHMHGLIDTDYISITPPSNTASTFLGITTTQLSGNFQVSVIDDFTVSITIIGTTPTASGVLSSSGIINEIQVDNGGSGYTPGNLTLSFTGGGGSGAAAHAIVNSAGTITSVIIDSVGSLYTSAPSVTIPGTYTSAASLFVISEAVFKVYTNRRFNEFMPVIASFAPADSTIQSTFTGLSDAYALNNVPYNIRLNNGFKLPTSSIYLSPVNKTHRMPGVDSSVLTLTLNTNNPNISPIINPNVAANLESYAYLINNQTVYETLTATAGSAYISSYTITGGGYGYVSGAVTVSVSAPDIATGVQAVPGTVTVVGNIITAVAVGTAGSGYTKPPVITISTTSGTISTPAIITPVLSPFNTELLPTGGKAKSRYITKRFTLATVSSGATVIVNAYSGQYSTFDVYIRTSLQANNVVHTNQSWAQLICGVQRNMSKNDSDFNDYKFELFGIAPFDVYDIKIVFRTTSRTMVPIIKNFRAVITAT